MADVKVVKFATGLELIAKVITETPTELVVDSPLALQAMRSSNSAEGISIGLVPFSWAGAPTSVALNKIHVLCVMEPDPQVKTQYLAGLAGISVPQGASVSDRPKLTLVE